MSLTVCQRVHGEMGLIKLTFDDGTSIWFPWPDGEETCKLTKALRRLLKEHGDLQRRQAVRILQQWAIKSES